MSIEENIGNKVRPKGIRGVNYSKCTPTSLKNVKLAIASPPCLKLLFGTNL